MYEFHEKYNVQNVFLIQVHAIFLEKKEKKKEKEEKEDKLVKKQIETFSNIKYKLP